MGDQPRRSLFDPLLLQHPLFFGRYADLDRCGGTDCRILHTGDLAADFHDFPQKEDDRVFDLCVCEATHIWNHKEVFLEKLMKAPLRRLVLNHIGPFWTDGKEASLKELVSPLPYPVQIADDGIKILIKE